MLPRLVPSRLCSAFRVPSESIKTLSESSELHVQPAVQMIRLPTCNYRVTVCNWEVLACKIFKMNTNG